ncbi:MAG: AmmeMemoRadiSam system protein B [Anaerolineales bacterium]
MITNNVRPSPIAGTWYSANPSQLRQTLDAFIENAVVPDLPGDVIALVAPHAGYRYSGPVAGYAYKAVLGKKYDIVAVLSPMHQYYPQPLLTSAHLAYRTPLGEIALAKEEIAQIDTALKDRTGLTLTPIANDQEHSLEIELPFLQRALADEFTLIPIMMRDQTRHLAFELGKILASVLQGTSCLLVASSDLSHFYPENVANRLDQTVLHALSDFSPDELFDLKDQGKGHACGLAPIATVLWAAKAMGATEVTLLNYDTSATTSGDSSSVVGYGAAAVTRPA